MQVARHKNHARKYNFLCSQLRRGGQKKHWTASFISVYNWPSKIEIQQFKKIPRWSEHSCDIAL